MNLPAITPAPSGVALISITVITGFLATVAVGLRLWSRRIVGLQWGLDDYLALASIVVFLPQVFLTTFGGIYGGIAGRPQTEVLALSPGAISYGLKVCPMSWAVCLRIPGSKSLQLDYIAQYLYGFSSSAIKLSLLAFYWRLFPSGGVRTGVYILSSLTIGWFVAVTVRKALQSQSAQGFLSRNLTFFA